MQIENIKETNSSQDESIASLISKDESIDSEIESLQQRTLDLEQSTGLFLTATISKDNWSGTSAPYSNTVSGLSGITSDSHPTISLNLSPSSTTATYKNAVKAFGMIGAASTIDEGIVFYSFNKNPGSIDIDIPISIREM